MRFKVGDQFTMYDSGSGSIEYICATLGIKPEAPGDVIFVVIQASYSDDDLNFGGDKYTLSYYCPAREVVVSGDALATCFVNVHNSVESPVVTSENLKVRIKDASAFIKHNLNGTQLQKKLTILLCCKESFELVGLSKLNDKGMVVTNLTWGGDYVALYADELQFLEII